LNLVLTGKKSSRIQRVKKHRIPDPDPQHPNPHLCLLVSNKHTSLISEIRKKTILVPEGKKAPDPRSGALLIDF
jgi:hypothetical protein